MPTIAEDLGERVVEHAKIEMTMAELGELRDQVDTLKKEKAELIGYAQELKNAFDEMDKSLNIIADEATIPSEPDAPLCMD